MCPLHREWGGANIGAHQRQFGSALGIQDIRNQQTIVQLPPPLSRRHTSVLGINGGKPPDIPAGQTRQAGSVLNLGRHQSFHQLPTIVGRPAPPPPPILRSNGLNGYQRFPHRQTMPIRPALPMRPPELSNNPAIHSGAAYTSTLRRQPPPYLVPNQQHQRQNFYPTLQHNHNHHSQLPPPPPLPPFANHMSRQNAGKVPHQVLQRHAQQDPTSMRPPAKVLDHRFNYMPNRSNHNQHKEMPPAFTDGGGINPTGECFPNHNMTPPSPQSVELDGYDTSMHDLDPPYLCSSYSQLEVFVKFFALLSLLFPPTGIGAVICAFTANNESNHRYRSARQKISLILASVGFTIILFVVVVVIIATQVVN